MVELIEPMPLSPISTRKGGLSIQGAVQMHRHGMEPDCMYCKNFDVWCTVAKLTIFMRIPPIRRNERCTYQTGFAGTKPDSGDLPRISTAFTLQSGATNAVRAFRFPHPAAAVASCLCRVFMPVVHSLSRERFRGRTDMGPASGAPSAAGQVNRVGPCALSLPLVRRHPCGLNARRACPARRIRRTTFPSSNAVQRNLVCRTILTWVSSNAL